MKNTRLQTPDARETANSKVQTAIFEPANYMKLRSFVLNPPVQSSTESGRGLPRSTTLARNFRRCWVPQRFGVRQPCAVLALVIIAIIGLTGFTPWISSAATSGKVFARPEDAVAELRKATSTADTQALHELFGPEADDLQNPDRVQAASDLATFNAALRATNQLVRTSDTNIIIEVGDDLWPFPIPLVKEGTGWHFDADAGKEELINRRIGRNELDVLKATRAYVDAQREYASLDRDGDAVLEYAQRIRSSPGKTDGLYWPIELNGQESPLGPMVAEAQQQGYFRNKSAQNAQLAPFHGYYFRILTRQGKNAPGGKYDYIINGNMIGGFALVAWPAQYGDTGIMTFIVNQQGRVYQKDLGPQTATIAAKMTEYDPDPSWQVSPQ
jgi:hypothetical protein